jgi:hypothetical protein
MTLARRLLSSSIMIFLFCMAAIVVLQYCQLSIKTKPGRVCQRRESEPSRLSGRVPGSPDTPHSQIVL